MKHNGEELESSLKGMDLEDAASDEGEEEEEAPATPLRTATTKKKNGHPCALAPEVAVGSPLLTSSAMTNPILRHHRCLLSHQGQQVYRL